MDRFVSLLLAAIFLLFVFLPGCDSSGSAESDPGPSRADVTGTWRLVSSNDFDATESEYDLYYDGTTEGTTLHTCTFDDTHIRERVSAESQEVNESGNLVITDVIENGKKDENVAAIYDPENEGGETVIEYRQIEEDRLVWEVVSSAQADIVGNVDELESTSGVPTSDTECENREQFHD